MEEEEEEKQKQEEEEAAYEHGRGRQRFPGTSPGVEMLRECHWPAPGPRDTGGMFAQASAQGRRRRTSAYGAPVKGWRTRHQESWIREQQDTSEWIPRREYHPMIIDTGILARGPGGLGGYFITERTVDTYQPPGNKPWKFSVGVTEELSGGKGYTSLTRHDAGMNASK